VGSRDEMVLRLTRLQPSCEGNRQEMTNHIE
jgi:hypothetical protein